MFEHTDADTGKRIDKKKKGKALAARVSRQSFDADVK